MATERIIMPQLGESVTEGTISKWMIGVGEHVNKYDPLAEVMTDKVNAEVPSSFTGVIKELIAGEGETLAVGEVMCTIETEQVVEQTQTVVNVEEKSSEEDEDKEELVIDKKEKIRYSPAVLKLSQEHDIDLNQVKGTGAGGRITRKDVLRVLENGEIQKTAKTETNPVQTSVQVPVHASNHTAQLTAQSVINVPIVQGDVAIPINGVRKAIADKMVRSKNEIPHAWMMVEVDVTNLVDYRHAIKDKFKKQEGYNLTFFAFFVKAVAQALKEYPQLNSMWAGDKIIRKNDVNLSIAVATEDELFTPIIKHADEKTIKGIAREINDLAIKVRNGKLTVEDLQGGTFTVNNTGSIGSVQSMGIINHPQVAILQVESIIKRPVVMENNMIAVRDMINLCLSLDHRVLDGFICGKFLHRIKEILEKTSKENTTIY
ncbi:2-oxo acid dehydrogenase subunit E2 [Bacillus sp. V3B]|uniref:dihydrolipoamide acetyltransferase family protein n=1 Tax=Bacillus sp. V3B TaxID=2804915 RepID=UPI002108F49E|nr:dihydrolipoamide acetyltransferase family protein [Bacillus sp. V3B]MCQ6273766.1 2-oxo acid dehydrogenase subunit E2 [Bacillus sp. V3B]